MLWIIDDKYQKDIGDIAITERLPKGAILDSESIYYLQNGLCVLNHLTEEGGEKTISYFMENSLMGFFPFLLKYITSAHKTLRNDFFVHEGYIIKTRSICRVLRIDGERFFSLLEKRPNLSRSVLCSLTQNYINTNELLVEIIHSPAPARVCRIIHEFKSRKENRVILSPHLTYYDIGIFTALHTITVTKIFKALFLGGILTKKGRTIFIEDEEALREIAKSKKLLVYKY